MEERLTDLVKHSKMLKTTKKDFEKFHRDTSAFLNESSHLIDELKMMDKERSDNDDFEDIEVRNLF